MSILIALTIGVLGSLIASVLFLIFLYRFTPRILISQKIARLEDDEGRIYYQIKIANFTTRSVVDINFALYRVDVTMASEYGQQVQVKWLEEIPLNLSSKKIPELSPFNPGRKSTTDYACKIRTYESIENQWKGNNTYLRFIVYATDSLSGLNKVFSKDYISRNELVDQPFKIGELKRIWDDKTKLDEQFCGDTEYGAWMWLKYKVFIWLLKPL
jgi:hypothetical protein